MGYSLGSIDWDVTSIGQALGGHVRAVFTLITFIFIFCVSVTISSFNEIPLHMLESSTNEYENTEKAPLESENNQSYGAMEGSQEGNPPLTTEQQKKKMSLNLVSNNAYSTLPGENVAETSFASDQIVSENQSIPVEEGVASLSHYLMSIVFMPHSLRMVCVTNLFCWMAHVCYSLYFTDFVGEAVFNGDPKVRNFYSYSRSSNNMFPYTLRQCLDLFAIIFTKKEYALDVLEWQCTH